MSGQASHQLRIGFHDGEASCDEERNGTDIIWRGVRMEHDGNGTPRGTVAVTSPVRIRRYWIQDRVEILGDLDPRFGWC